MINKFSKMIPMHRQSIN